MVFGLPSAALTTARRARPRPRKVRTRRRVLRAIETHTRCRPDAAARNSAHAEKCMRPGTRAQTILPSGTGHRCARRKSRKPKAQANLKATSKYCERPSFLKRTGTRFGRLLKQSHARDCSISRALPRRLRRVGCSARVPGAPSVARTRLFHHTRAAHASAASAPLQQCARLA